jgi:hypothetical protein
VIRAANPIHHPGHYSTVSDQTDRILKILRHAVTGLDRSRELAPLLTPARGKDQEGGIVIVSRNATLSDTGE